MWLKHPNPIPYWNRDVPDPIPNRNRWSLALGRKQFCREWGWNKSLSSIPNLGFSESLIYLFFCLDQMQLSAVIAPEKGREEEKDSLIRFHKGKLVPPASWKREEWTNHFSVVSLVLILLSGLWDDIASFSKTHRTGSRCLICLSGIFTVEVMLLINRGTVQQARGTLPGPRLGIHIWSKYPFYYILWMYVLFHVYN